MPVNQELKNQINFIKYSLELTQEEIAQKLGVKNTYLSDMINGRVPYSNKIRGKISELSSNITPQPSTPQPESGLINELLQKLQQLSTEHGKALQTIEQLNEKITELKEEICTLHREMEQMEKESQNTKKTAQQTKRKGARL